MLALLAAGATACGTSAARGTTGGGPPGSGHPAGSTPSHPTSAPSTTAPAPTTTTSIANAGLQVGSVVVSWTEPNGTVENFYDGTTTQGRTMQVEIRYPTLDGKPKGETHLAPPATRLGPYPVIVFAHGYDVDPDVYRSMLDAWVTAGFVVVSPVFPDTSQSAVAAQHGVDTEQDEFNQPGDVAFVAAQVTAAAHGSPVPGGRWLAGLVDPTRLALAGQSDGANTVAALLYDQAYAAVKASLPVQPRAVALLSGAEWTRAQDVYAAPAGGPAALVVQSAQDACNLPQDSAQLYNLIPGDKWYLGLASATHLGPYVGIDQAASTVAAVTTDFFSLALRPGSTSPATLVTAGNVPGVSEITSAAMVAAAPAPSVPPGVDPCSLSYSEGSPGQ